jgi:hypothetical protein
MTDVGSALIGASTAILGGMATGLWAHLNLRISQQAERERWDREADERRRTRFHEDRLAAYEDFQIWASNAFGYLSAQAIEGQKRPPDDATVFALMSQRDPSVEHPECNRDAARQMLRRKTKVVLLTHSPDVRDAATEVVNAVLSIAAVAHDDRDWNTRVMDITARVGEAQQRFMDAAADELAS